MLKAKKTLQIDLGHSCNNNCIFCMEPRTSNYPITTEPEYFERILKKNAGGFDRVMFTHREPTLNEYLPRLIRRANMLDYQQIMLITNGRMLQYREYLEELIDKGLNILGISIHGHNKEIHEAMTRTPGSFEQTRTGLEVAKYFRQSGKLDFFTTHTTITKLNYKYLKEIYLFLNKYGIDRALFNLFDPRGEASEKAEILMPNPSDLKRVIKEVGNEIAQMKIDFIGIPYCLGVNMNNLGGVEEAYLDKNGSTRMDSCLSREMKGYCHICSHFGNCPGIHQRYLKEFGNNIIKPFINSGFSAVIADLKPAHRGTLIEDNFKMLKKYARTLDLKIERSDFYLSFKEGKTIKSDNFGPIMYYLSKDENMNMRLKQLEEVIFNEMGDHIEETREMGEILGYPDCCIDFFIKNQDLSTMELYYLAAQNTKTFPRKELNLFNNYQQISHVPCSFDCESSVEIAKKMLTLLNISENSLKEKYILFADKKLIIYSDINKQKIIDNNKESVIIDFK